MTFKKNLMLAAFGAAFIVAAAAPSWAANEQNSSEAAPRSRPAQIIVHPRNRPLGPNAQRQCQAWLEKEYRVSGPVIVPRERCWWQ